LVEQNLPNSRNKQPDLIVEAYQVNNSLDVTNPSHSKARLLYVQVRGSVLVQGLVGVPESGVHFLSQVVLALPNFHAAMSDTALLNPNGLCNQNEVSSDKQMPLSRQWALPSLH
jgi:hypothetical protein